MRKGRSKAEWTAPHDGIAIMNDAQQTRFLYPDPVPESPLDSDGVCHLPPVIIE
jgi:hypothetical protein